MVEINGQAFKEGDTVHFKQASLPCNRNRDYRITAITAGGIEASTNGFTYGFALATATRLGIAHASTK